MSLLLATQVFSCFASEKRSEEEEFFSLIDTDRIGITHAVASQDWGAAKEGLLKYYKEKFASIDWIEPAGGDNSYREALYDALYIDEGIIDQAPVSTEQTEISFSVSKSNIRSTYILSTLIHSETSGICMVSSEADPAKGPRLVVNCDDGSTVTLTASHDAYARATGYDSSSENRDTKFGVTDEKNLWASHRSDVKNRMPYSDDDMRTYVSFDLSKLGGKTAESAVLKITAQVKSFGKTVTADGETLPLFLLLSTIPSFDENTLDWRYLEKQNALGHYSWDGLGGIIYDEELYGRVFCKLHVPQQFVAHTSRFLEEASLCYHGYNEKAKDFVLRFAEQTYDLLKYANKNKGGFPKVHAIGTANRVGLFPYIYKCLLDSNVMTSEENYKILRWFYQEIQYIVYEKSETIFVNGGAEPNKKTNYYKDNFGPWHVSSLFCTFAFWDEFRESGKWSEIFDGRLDVLSDILTYDDGSYVEVTFGYPNMVVSRYRTMMYYMGKTGYESEAARTVLGRLIGIIKYMIDCSYPNGALPAYGDGGTVSAYSVADFLSGIDVPAGLEDEKLAAITWYRTRTDGTRPDQFAFYEDAKLVTDRTGWSASDSMFFMNAKSGGVHAHKDSLAILLYAFGKNLLVDTDCITYDGASPAFVLVSRTNTHNTVEVDGRGQRAKGTYVSEGYDGADKNIVPYTNDSMTVVRAYTTSNERVTHYRNAAYLKEYGSLVIVNDLLTPSDSRTHSYTQNWHPMYGSNAAVSDSIGGFDDNLWGQTNFDSGANLMIAQILPDGEGEINASVKTDYDNNSPTQMSDYFEFSQSGTGNVTFSTVIAPYKRQTLGVRAVRLDTDTGDDVSTAMIIERYDSPALEKLTDRIAYYNSFEDAPARRTVSYGDGMTFTTDAFNAYYHISNDGTVDSATVVNGTELTVEGANGDVLKVRAGATVSDLSVRYDAESGKVEINTSDEGVISGATGITVAFCTMGNIASVKLNGKKTSGFSFDGNVLVSASYAGDTSSELNESDKQTQPVQTDKPADPSASGANVIIPVAAGALAVVGAAVAVAAVKRKKKKKS